MIKRILNEKRLMIKRLLFHSLITNIRKITKSIKLKSNKRKKKLRFDIGVNDILKQFMLFHEMFPNIYIVRSNTLHMLWKTSKLFEKDK